MNKKGFAISVILYVIVFLIIAIFYLLLGIIKSRYNATTGLKSNIVTTLNGVEHIYTKLDKDDPVSVLRIDPNDGVIILNNEEITDVIEIVKYEGETVVIPNATGKPNTNNGSYVLSYNANGGDTTPASQTIPLITSYNFASWEPNGDCSGFVDGVYTFPDTYGTSCTLTASWNHSDSSRTVKLANGITKLCNIFSGWKSSVNNQNYQAGANYTVNDDTVMTAQWTLHVEAQYVEYNNSELGCNDVQCAINEINNRINNN